MTRSGVRSYGTLSRPSIDTQQVQAAPQWPVQSRHLRPDEPADPYQLIYPREYFENADARAGPARPKEKHRSDAARAGRVPPEIRRHLDSLKSNMMRRKAGARGARLDTQVI